MAEKASISSDITSVMTENTTTEQTVNNAQEVGWVFVHEYYTILNRLPDKIHCFYGSNSILFRGKEGQPATVSVGEQEIQKRFKQLSLDNCRVLITSVDSQTSLNGAIVVQVLGQMCNGVEEHSRRFAQTFFLAVQPRGYYVLNDIIRFLDEDDDADNEVDEAIPSTIDESVTAEDTDEETGTSPTGTLVEEPIGVPILSDEIPDMALDPTITEQTVLPHINNGSEVALDVNNVVEDRNNIEMLETIATVSTPPTQHKPIIIEEQQIQTDSSLSEHNAQLGSTSSTANDSTIAKVAPCLPSTLMQNDLSQSVLYYPPIPIQRDVGPPLNPNQRNISPLPVSTQNNTYSVHSITDTQIAPVNQQPVSAQGNLSPPTALIQSNSSVINTTEGTQPLPVNQKPAVPMVNGQVINSPFTYAQRSSVSIGLQRTRASDISEQHTIVKSVPTVTKNESIAVNSNYKQIVGGSTANQVPKQTNSVTTVSQIHKQNNGGSTVESVQKQVNWGSPIVKQVNEETSVKSSVQKQVNDQLSLANSSEAKEQNISGGQDMNSNKQSSTQPHPKQQAPQTWAANLREKWGDSNVEIKPQGAPATTPAQKMQQKPAPQNQVQVQQMRDNKNTRQEGQKGNRRNSADTSLSIYIKGVSQKMSYDHLKAALSAFGNIKHLDVIYQKSCAFVEYTEVESYKECLNKRHITVGSAFVTTEERRPHSRGNTSRTNKAPRGKGY